MNPPAANVDSASGLSTLVEATAAASAVLSSLLLSNPSDTSILLPFEAIGSSLWGSSTSIIYASTASTAANARPWNLELSDSPSDFLLLLRL